MRLKGYFTLIRFVAGLPYPALEKRLGFQRDHLKSGFLLAVLADHESIRKEDFVLRASTLSPRGVIRLDGAQEVQIEDGLRCHGQDVMATREQVAQFLMRRGRHTPAKIIPRGDHLTAAMDYPRAEALGPGMSPGVPQFELLVEKNFLIVDDESLATYRGVAGI